MPIADDTSNGQRRVIVAKIRKFGYAGRDSIDDVKAWIEKRYDAVTVNGQSISLDQLEQIGLKHVAEGIGADLDDNGNVGASDLLVLLANWGPCP